ncbi:hypothetical protein [Seonamhaeicola sp.]|uniref:hypothetical protein n=1 Tax=Seonamhaeicola sp. TaxID=1912245 RepID=UPI0026114A24|nr:hypothetical protein [Seonamhaeicola sp.]
MKKIACLVMLLCYGYYSSAQIGIGTTNPESSSILHVESSDRGLLPPRVSLTSVNDISTIPAPTEGLMVYSLSTNNCNLPAGLYIFNGSVWQRVSFSGGTKTYSRLVKDEIGVGSVTFTAYNASNSYGHYNSLFDDVNNTGGNTFHMSRVGSPAGDWGFGISFPGQYFISQVILDGRNECCTNRIENVVIRLYSCGNLVYSSPAISSSSTGDNTVSIPNIYADEIRLVVPNGGTTPGGSVINFTELDIVGYSYE